MESPDLVVLGTGIAGLATALAAHEHGLRPLVLEKDGKVGGGTTESAGLIWVGDNHLGRAAGYVDDGGEIAAYTRFLAGGEEHEANFQAFYGKAGEALQFFERCGIRFQLTRGLPDHYFGTAPGARAEGRSLEVQLISGYDLGEWRTRVRMRPDSPAYVTCGEMIAWGGANRAPYWDRDLVKKRRDDDMRGQGVGLICHFLKALLARGVPVRTGETVERLLVDRGRVTGVATASGDIVAGHGVVIATGGYESNPALVRDLDGWTDWISQFPPALAGDGLMLATEIGAAFRRQRNNMQLFLGYPIPPATGADEPRIQQAGIIEMHSPHTMVVNRAGRRFADEAYFQDIIPALRLFDPSTHDYPNVPCFLVFDAQYAAAYAFAGQAPGEPVPQWVACDDRLAGLAARLGIDGSELERTAARFNGFARAGNDADFNRGGRAWRMASHANASGRNLSLGTIEKPPFYGLKLHPCGSGSVGILTNEWGQVMHQRRHPIAGLYAVGNAAARTEFGAGYQAGLTLASGMTFGLLVARHAQGVRAQAA